MYKSTSSMKVKVGDVLPGIGCLQWKRGLCSHPHQTEWRPHRRIWPQCWSPHSGRGWKASQSCRHVRQRILICTRVH